MRPAEGIKVTVCVTVQSRLVAKLRRRNEAHSTVRAEVRGFALDRSWLKFWCVHGDAFLPKQALEDLRH